MNIAQWLYVLLKPHVDDMAVAHGADLRRQRSAKTDAVDAMRLATELRCGTISRVFHDETPLWDLRSLVSSYQDFTEDLAKTKIRYKSFLRSRGHMVQGSAIYNDEEFIKNFEKVNDKFVAAAMFQSIASRQKIKDSYEERFVSIAAKLPIIRKLSTIPGISTIRASVIAAVVCSAERFPDKHRFWSYARLVRHVEISDGKVYGSRKARGRSELKAVFMGAATSVLAGESSLRKYYDRLRSKGLDDRKAKKAVARKIAAIALMIMKTGKLFDDHHDEKERKPEKKKLT